MTQPVTHSSIAGCDIRCVVSVGGSVREWATLQTISISTARTVVPVRALGDTLPVGFTRGARTFAGSLVFATIDEDEVTKLMGIYQQLLRDKKKVPSDYWYDALPPFNVVVLGANEYGHKFRQVIYDVVITNWGATYSVDDLLLEQTYTYVARYATPITIGAINRGSVVVQHQVWESELQNLA